MFNEPGISENTTDDLLQRVLDHKKDFIRIFKGRYKEMLPSLIKYENTENTSIDFLKVEVALRNNYEIAIGRTTENNLQVLGIVKSKQTDSNPANLFISEPLTQDDIDFVIPKRLQLDHLQEISHYDRCETGDFVVLRNKTINQVNDYAILDFYVKELAEISLSRYSISMQAKINTLFLGDVNDETITEIVNLVYSGAPYIKTSHLFEPEEQIYHMNNDNIAHNFVELKREYQNKISELNNMLGMNALAVEKASGVSDSEAKGNRAYSTTNANIYLDGRNQGLEKLNKRFPDVNIMAMYDDEVASEFGKIAYSDDKEGNNENSNDL